MCVCVCAKTKVDGNSHTRYYFWVLGVLACLDGYMNIAMEQTEEFVDGQLKAKYGDCFVRGNNGELFTWGRRFYLYIHRHMQKVQALTFVQLRKCCIFQLKREHKKISNSI
jgi:hypothetical protein